MKTQTTKVTVKRNGIDLNALHETIKGISAKPELGAAKFRVSNRWIGGSHNRSCVEDFYAAGKERVHLKKFQFDAGEHPVLLGGEEGANPVEFVLHALAGCITTTTAYHAAARGINIESIETSLEGDIDLRGLLQIDPNVPTGYQQIRVTMNIKSDAEGKKIEELKKLYTFSPVYGTLTQPVKVDIDVKA